MTSSVCVGGGGTSRGEGVKACLKRTIFFRHYSHDASPSRVLGSSPRHPAPSPKPQRRPLGSRIWPCHARDRKHPPLLTAWPAPAGSLSQGLPGRPNGASGESSVPGADMRYMRWQSGGGQACPPGGRKPPQQAHASSPPAPARMEAPRRGGARGSRSPPGFPCPTRVASHLSEEVAATREAAGCGDPGSGGGTRGSGGGRQWRSEGQTH